MVVAPDRLADTGQNRQTDIQEEAMNTIKRITEALVQNMQEGTTSSAHNFIRICCQEGYPDFDDGKVLKKVFASTQFKKLIREAVEEEIELEDEE